jgi:hypothetical protein
MDLVKAGGFLLALSLAAWAGRLSAGTRDVIPAAGANPAQQAPSTRQAIGYSKNFSFDEAFKDAMQKLPQSKPTHPDQMTRIKVEETGAELGGIAGFHHLFVRITATSD